jgi:hypothetical protein
VVAVERVTARGLQGSESDAWFVMWLFRLIRFKEGKIWRVKKYPTRTKPSTPPGCGNRQFTMLAPA